MIYKYNRKKLVEIETLVDKNQYCFYHPKTCIETAQKLYRFRTDIIIKSIVNY